MACGKGNIQTSVIEPLKSCVFGMLPIYDHLSIDGQYACVPEDSLQKRPEKIIDKNDMLTDLKCCCAKRDLQFGRLIHANAVNINEDINTYVVTGLINMYGKCGTIIIAQDLFDNIQVPNVVSWTALIFGYAENRKGHVALEIFSRMKQSSCTPNYVTYIAALKACTSLAVTEDKRWYLELGRQIHSSIGCHSSDYVYSTLIDMYAKYGSMVEARCVFDSMEKPDLVAWNNLILGYADNGKHVVALDLFAKMKSLSGCSPDSVTYVAALKACTCLIKNGDENGRKDCLERGKAIHLEVGAHLNRYVQNTLIDMYGKCDCMVEAHRVFQDVQRPDVVSWNSLLLGYAENGEGQVVLDLFSQMKASMCAPDSLTYVAALKACLSLAMNGNEAFWLERGRELHSEVGCHLNPCVQSTLIDMYAKCGSMIEAHDVFDSIHKPDVVSWNALLLGYVENEEGHAALDLFSKMKADGYIPGSITYVAVFKACGLVGGLSLGRKFHSEITCFDSHVVSCLIDFYAKCGSMVEAREVFDLHQSSRNIPVWTALLAGYARLGDTNTVFILFEDIRNSGLLPDSVTCLCILSCCSHAGLLEKARSYFEAMPIHYQVVPSVMHYNCMVDVLGRVNELSEAIRMVQKMPCDPNVGTWVGLLEACYKWKNVDFGVMAFQALLNMNKKNGSGYILIARIYGSLGLWAEQEAVLKTRRVVLGT